MATVHNPNDTVTIAPTVLHTIVRMAALSVDGVERTSGSAGGVDRWFRRVFTEEGIRIEVDEDAGVRVDVYLVVKARRNLYETSRRVQAEVAMTIEEYAGMKVRGVNVHIEDILFEKA
ncbi:MAG: Asp23/Gls24 family envelope stress response protein [Chloroflexi bacterium]|nr:Asp23/Gls24 family envelope stress response protein [Chloroflexota bacterium]